MFQKYVVLLVCFRAMSTNPVLSLGTYNCGRGPCTCRYAWYTRLLSCKTHTLVIASLCSSSIIAHCFRKILKRALSAIPCNSWDILPSLYRDHPTTQGESPLFVICPFLHSVRAVRYPQSFSSDCRGDEQTLAPDSLNLIGLNGKSPSISDPPAIADTSASFANISA